MNVRVAATGIGTFGRRSEGLVDLLAEAGSRALEELGRKPVDLLVVGSMAAGPLGDVENVVAQTADRLGLDAAAGLRVEAASASGAAAFHVGVDAANSRRADRVLVLAGEKMTGRSTAEVATVLGRSLAPSEVAAGATMPGLAALATLRYTDRFGEEPGVFDRVAADLRTRAVRNPYAQFRNPVTPEEVARSRLVAPPLRLLHCSAVSDGAAAVVLEHGTHGVRVAGLGQSIEVLAAADRIDLTGFRATRFAAKRAYEMARRTRKDVQVIELHDAFAPFALFDLEDLGFAGPGEAGALWMRGVTDLQGSLPVNPSGGLLGRGHPVGASGLAGLVEVVRQLDGTAGPTAVGRRPRVGLAQSIGGLGSHNFVTLLEAPEVA